MFTKQMITAAALTDAIEAMRLRGTSPMQVAEDHIQAEPVCAMVENGKKHKTKKPNAPKKVAPKNVAPKKANTKAGAKKNQVAQNQSKKEVSAKKAASKAVAKKAAQKAAQKADIETKQKPRVTFAPPKERNVHTYFYKDDFTSRQYTEEEFNKMIEKKIDDTAKIIGQCGGKSISKQIMAEKLDRQTKLAKLEFVQRGFIIVYYWTDLVKRWTEGQDNEEAIKKEAKGFFEAIVEPTYWQEAGRTPPSEWEDDTWKKMMQEKELDPFLEISAEYNHCRAMTFIEEQSQKEHPQKK